MIAGFLPAQLYLYEIVTTQCPTFYRVAALAAAALVLGWLRHTPSHRHPAATAAGCRAMEMSRCKQGTMIVDLQEPPRPSRSCPMICPERGTSIFPLLDTNITAIGKSPHELEDTIHDLYVPNIFTHISVTVTPGPRYYYVSGEINNIGRTKQLYTGKVTVLGAIGAAGGFNDFAARKRVQLTRQDGTIYIVDCMKALKNPKLWIWKFFRAIRFSWISRLLEAVMPGISSKQHSKSTPVTPAAAAMVQLQFLSGQKAGAQFTASRLPLQFGRAAEADLSLEEPGVWPRHFQIARQGRDLVCQAEAGALLSVNGVQV